MSNYDYRDTDKKLLSGELCFSGGVMDSNMHSIVGNAIIEHDSFKRLAIRRDEEFLKHYLEVNDLLLKFISRYREEAKKLTHSEFTVEWFKVNKFAHGKSGLGQRLCKLILDSISTL